MIVQELLDIFDEWAPLDYSEDFDNTGLIIGSPNDKCNGILISLDTTEEVLEEAIKKNYNVIVSFHPIIFSDLKKITGETYVERVVSKALRNNISIIALHTRLDNHPEGVNHEICKRIGLIKTETLIPKKGTLKKLVVYVPKNKSGKVLKALHDAGAGNLENYTDCSFLLEGKGQFTGNKKSDPHVGKKLEKVSIEEVQINVVFESYLKGKVQEALFEAHPYETVAYEMYSLLNSYTNVGMGKIGFLKNEINSIDFLKKLKKIFNTGHIRYNNFEEKKLNKIAVLGGSGSFAIEKAKSRGADAFITADLKYHQFFQGDRKMLLVDIGHYESEQYTKNLIFDHLSKKLPNFAVALATTKTNPVNYI